MTEEQKGALTGIVEAGVASEKLSRLPAELTAAQCLLLEIWNAPGFNPFGIRKQRRHAEGIEIDGISLAKYASIRDALDDHAALIITGERLRPARVAYRADHNLEALVRAVDPERAEQLLALIGDPEFAAAIEAARNQ